MLYVTTREKYDAFTAARTLAADAGADGGRYVPYKMPRLTSDALSELKDKTVGQTIAEVLNQFFSAGLTAWDVEFCIGRTPLKVVSMGQKVYVAECWRNMEGSYEKLERMLAGRICSTTAEAVCVTSWLRIAIRIAVLTAVFGELQRQGMEGAIDIAVSDGDFTVTMAVWYARQIGLPVANIVCACQDGSPAWELLNKGKVRTAGLKMPELERLIFGALGIAESMNFVHVCGDGGIYELAALQLERLRAGIEPAIVSGDRISVAIPNVFRTNSYILEPDTAKAYSGLMDYRANKRETRAALLLADSSPADHAGIVAAALKISNEKLKELLR